MGLALQENFPWLRVPHLAAENQGAWFWREQLRQAASEAELASFVPKMEHHLEENNGRVPLQGSQRPQLLKRGG